MKKLRPLLLFNLLFILALTVLLYLSFQEKDRLAYVDNAVLFSEFTMSKELRERGAVELQKQERKLDSLYAVARSKDSLPETHRTLMSQEIKKLQALKTHYTEESIQKVWDRLNTYLALYGNKESYQIIMGTQGSGNIMYADKKLDITSEVLEFVNKKYAGN